MVQVHDRQAAAAAVMPPLLLHITHHSRPDIAMHGSIMLEMSALAAGSGSMAGSLSGSCRQKQRHAASISWTAGCRASCSNGGQGSCRHAVSAAMFSAGQVLHEAQRCGCLALVCRAQLQWLRGCRQHSRCQARKQGTVNCAAGLTGFMTCGFSRDSGQAGIVCAHASN